MRIIAGDLRGRQLRTVKDLSVRPATDRARQVIFDVLHTRMELDGATVLDLFAGSGSLGFEALSRGAASVMFVEGSRPTLDVLHENIRSLGVGDRCEVIHGDVFRFLKDQPRRFDLVFVDPPYKLETIASLPDLVGRSGVVRPEGWLVMEHSSFTPVEPDSGLFEVLRKRLGQTVLLILRRTGRPASTVEP